MSTRADDAGVVEGADDPGTVEGPDDVGAVEGAGVIAGRAGCAGLSCEICAAAGITISAASAMVIAKGRNFIGNLYRA